MDTSGIPTFNLDGYEPDAIQRRALKTWAGGGARSEQLVHAVMGLAGESGELLDKVKKGLFKPGYTLDPNAVMDEAGDALYYLAILTSLMGVSFEALSRLNRAKLSGGGHGWRENEGEDMATFTPEEAERRISEAVKNKELGPAQFNAVVMGILKGLENEIRNEITLEFVEDVVHQGFHMAVKPTFGSDVLFTVFLPNTRVLSIQRGE